MFSRQTYPKSFIKNKIIKIICGCIFSMKDEFWANGFKLYGPHIIFTIHFGKTPEIYSCWANMVSSWRPIFISYNHISFIYLVKAYRLGLWIFFHSLTKFFIERKEKGVIFFITFFLFKNKYSKHEKKKKRVNFLLDLNAQVHYFF